MGASTGGTEALKNVLLGMPSEIPPILIVQHIPPVFSTAFPSRLNDLCPFDVKEAVDGDELQRNKVFIAPGGKQMGVRKLGERLMITINDDPAVNRHKPSVDYLFDSVCRISVEPAVAVILTGMGADGAKGMKKLRDMGFRTIGQDAATSVVYGMPKEAKNAGGVEFELPLERVAAKISELISNDNKLTRKKVG
jgi:two-component system chemotaxis response regulator CheB